MGSCSRRLLAALSLTVALAPNLSSCFLLDRLEGLEPGDVSGRAVREDATPARAARAEVRGSTRFVRGDDDGAFCAACRAAPMS